MVQANDVDRAGNALRAIFPACSLFRMSHRLMPFKVRGVGFRDRVAKIAPQRIERLHGIAAGPGRTG
jgi:hypothetical protein